MTNPFLKYVCRRQVVRHVCCGALTLLATGRAAAQRPAQSPARNSRHLERSLALARLDAAVHYFHPDVALRATAWDSAFSAQAPRIVDATSAADYSREIAVLLGVVGDPATRIVDTGTFAWQAEWTADSTLRLRRVTGARANPALADFVGRARSVIIDARAVDLRNDPIFEPNGLLSRTVLSRSLTTPAQRALVYSGFPPATMQSSGGYGISWRAVPGPSFEGSATREVAVAFVADQRTVLPSLAMAMLEQGRARIDSSGAPRIAFATESHRVEMGEGVIAVVRLSESAAAGDASAQQPKLASVPTDSQWMSAYPSRGYRMLAAARLWSTIHLFFPYKQHISGSWDAAFRKAAEEIEWAADGLAYGKALAAFARHIGDSHVNVANAALYGELFGTVPPPIQTQFVENRLVVTRILDSSAVRAGLSVGDEIVTIDGESIAAHAARLSAYIVSSTPQALQSRLSGVLLSGKSAQFPRALTVRGAAGGVRNVSMTYAALRPGTSNYKRTGSIFRMLPGNVGYADLERLPVAMVDSMFRTFAGASAIIFDMRGYPQGTAWSIAPRLNLHPEPRVAARFRRLIVSSPDTTRTTDYVFEQPIPPLGGATPYRGRTVMLIDERAISQAEHSGLFYERANNTTFIGTPTQGANGDVTNLILPGRVSMTFSGHDVRHADGRQLQRVGLAPAVRVAPTVAGIREGRDEVLIAALKHVGAPGDVPPDAYVEPAAAPRRVLPPEPPAEAWNSMGNTADYRIGLDRAIGRGGGASGHVTSLADGTTFGAFVQSIRADSLRGKRVRFSAWIRTLAVVTSGSSSGVGLWMRVDGGGGTLAFDNMGSRTVRGTTDWTQHSVVLDVPNDAEGILVGMLLNGTGEAWVDDATFEVVGSDVATTTMMEPRRDASRVTAQRTQFSAFPHAFRNLDFERIR